MKNTTTILLTALAAAGLCASVSQAADVTAALDLNSAYMWRGLTFNDGLVAQPSIDVAGPQGIGINVWGNFDIDDYNGTINDGEFSEVDFTVSYAIPVDGFDLGIGVIEYLFPEAGTNTNTREIYVEAGVELVENLTAGVFLTYDFDEVDDIYGNISLAYGYAVNDELSLELAGLLGYAGDKFAAGIDSGLHEYQISLSAAYALNESTGLGAFIAYTDAADSDVLPDAAVDVDVYGGLNVSYAF
jgi:uncharacterized protein (TIGR02001 family)